MKSVLTKRRVFVCRLKLGKLRRGDSLLSLLNRAVQELSNLPPKGAVGIAG